MISELNERSRAIFRYIVDSYLATGEPVGSRTIARSAQLSLSPASIRNVMADLEDSGLLYAPHTSAGRLPTEQGIRLYIDGLMQMGNLSQEERTSIETTCAARNRPMTDVLEQATDLLSGLSACAGLVVAPRIEGAIKQVQFVQLAPRRILVVLVFQSGLVENRVMNTEQDIPFTALTAASNYLNAKLSGQSLAAAEADIRREIAANETQLDTITQRLVENGLALAPRGGAESRIIIRGQSKLLEDVKALQDLERARLLMGYLEQQQNILKLMNSMNDAEGVQIFIGTENKIFDQSGWSMIIAPYRDTSEKIIGAMVDYTSRIVSRLVEGE
jgi:heat-inducible transcriptional repressor